MSESWLIGRMDRWMEGGIDGGRDGGRDLWLEGLVDGDGWGGMCMCCCRLYFGDDVCEYCNFSMKDLVVYMR